MIGTHPNPNALLSVPHHNLLPDACIVEAIKSINILAAMSEADIAADEQSLEGLFLKPLRQRIEEAIKSSDSHSFH
jgi:hypothetical protein